MGLENLILVIPENVEVIKKSMLRWSTARVMRMSESEIRQSDSLWRNPERWKIVDRDGNTLDSQQGYGYKKPYAAQKIIDAMNGRNTNK